MPKELKEVILRRKEGEKWGFRLVGGIDECLVLRVDKVLGKGTPAGRAGLEDGDIIVEVGGHSAITLTHQQVVNIVKEHRNTITFVVERGDHIVPNFSECFPRRDSVDVDSEDSSTYYQDAMSRGLGSRLGTHQFTTVGKMKVKVPKYNSPGDLYSEDTMDEMISGVGNIDADKLDPESAAFEKLKKKKGFDPKMSSVLEVINDQMNGRFVVDNSHLIEARRESRGVPRQEVSNPRKIDSKPSNVNSKPSDLTSKPSNLTTKPSNITSNQSNIGFQRQKSKSKLSMEDVKSSNKASSTYHQLSFDSSDEFSSDEEYFVYDGLEKFANNQNIGKFLGLGPEVFMTKSFHKSQESVVKIAPSWYDEGTPILQELGMIAKKNNPDKKHNLGPELQPDFKTKPTRKEVSKNANISDTEQKLNLPTSHPLKTSDNSQQTYIEPNNKRATRNVSSNAIGTTNTPNTKPITFNSPTSNTQNTKSATTNTQHIQQCNKSGLVRRNSQKCNIKPGLSIQNDNHVARYQTSPSIQSPQCDKPVSRQPILPAKCSRSVSTCCQKTSMSPSCKITDSFSFQENISPRCQVNALNTCQYKQQDLSGMGPEIFNLEQSKVEVKRKLLNQNVLPVVEDNSRFSYPHKMTFISFPFEDIGPEIFLEKTTETPNTCGLGPEIFSNPYLNEAAYQHQPANYFYKLVGEREEKQTIDQKCPVMDKTTQTWSQAQKTSHVLSERQCVIVGL